MSGRFEKSIGCKKCKEMLEFNGRWTWIPLHARPIILKLGFGFNSFSNTTLLVDAHLNEKY